MSRKKNHASAAQLIVAKAQAKGSIATTVKGALAFLCSNLPLPIPGLAYLNDPTGYRTNASRDRGEKWDKAISWTHGERSDKRASEVADRILKKHPGRPFSKVNSFCKKFTADIAERVTKRLSYRIAEHVAQGLSDNWPYRRSMSRWAGGEHWVYAAVGPVPNAVCLGKHVWSSNGKWSGTDSHARLCITPRCYDTFGSNLIIGGLVTLDCEAVGVREYRATWAAQSKGFGLNVVEGWIIRGYHVEGCTLEAARQKAEKARRERLAVLQVEKLNLSGVNLAEVKVTRADSVRAGNCVAGTSSYINAHADVLGGKSSIPADQLLKLADNQYTRAAVLRAIARTLAEGRLQGVTLVDGEAGEANLAEGTGGAEAMFAA